MEASDGVNLRSCCPIRSANDSAAGSAENFCPRPNRSLSKPVKRIAWRGHCSRPDTCGSKNDKSFSWEADSVSTSTIRQGHWFKRISWTNCCTDAASADDAIASRTIPFVLGLKCERIESKVKEKAGWPNVSCK